MNSHRDVTRSHILYYVLGMFPVTLRYYEGNMGGSQSSIEPLFFPGVDCRALVKKPAVVVIPFQMQHAPQYVFSDCTIGILQQKEMCPEILL